MNASNPVSDLFPEPKESLGNRTSDILESLGKYGIRQFAHAGQLGGNPGYIFRGEADFKQPFQCSLERRVRRMFGNDACLDGQALREQETILISCFISGAGGRATAIFYPNGKNLIQDARDDIFWWLSLMQHYGLATRLIDFTQDVRLAVYFAIEQHERSKNSACLLSNDLIIYGFPCKHLDDTQSNKTPFGPTPDGIDMNLAFGCEIGLSWVTDRYSQQWFKEHYRRKESGQAWGWDVPHYQNPRLESQRGMFVYPYDYPPDANKKLVQSESSQSWFIQNLSSKADDKFNLAGSVNELLPIRLRVAAEHTAALQKLLDERFNLNPNTVYERGIRVSL